ncbi:MAG: D-alanine--D-alanine ligase family protein [Candidatus Ozemobacteraceae bacterium]
MNASGKIQVGVIFGGRSGEHEVSLVSAQSIIKALDTNRFDVIPIGITKQGAWLVGAEPQGMLTAGGGAPQITAESGRPAVIGDPTHKGMVLLNGGRSLDKVKLDVIFPVVHGTYGEDGTLQGMLELADIPYVGCGVLASAVGMDKTSAKRLFRDAGLPIAPFHEYLRKDWREKSEDILNEIETEFGYPCFIKPVNSGSSVGISKAHDRIELAAAMTLAARYDRKILVESYINGREIEVAVLGNDAPIASVAGEIVPCREFYDYEAKYMDDRSELRIPAPVSPEKMKEIQALAIAAYRAIDGAGMARVDFFLERNTDRLVLNEVNTIPGFTSISMYPKMWEATGIAYPELVNRLVQLAFERHADKQESLQAVI